MGHYALSARITYGPVRGEDNDEVDIFLDGDLIGDIYKHKDLLNPGTHYYFITLNHDIRGPQRVYDRSKLPAAVAERILTHPLRVE